MDEIDRMDGLSRITPVVVNPNTAFTEQDRVNSIRRMIRLASELFCTQITTDLAVNLFNRYIATRSVGSPSVGNVECACVWIAEKYENDGEDRLELGDIVRAANREGAEAFRAVIQHVESSVLYALDFKLMYYGPYEVTIALSMYLEDPVDRTSLGLLLDKVRVDKAFLALSSKQVASVMIWYLTGRVVDSGVDVVKIGESIRS